MPKSKIEGRTPREEMDALLDLLLRFGVEMLKKHGELYPFGATVRSNGEIAFAARFTEDRKPQSNGILESLRSNLKASAERGEIRASGICVDVRVHREGIKAKDTMQVLLEHVAAGPVTVSAPYERKEHGEIYLGDLSAVPGESNIFSRSMKR